MTKWPKTLPTLLFLAILPLTSLALPKNGPTAGFSTEAVILQAEANIDFSRPVFRPDVEAILRELIACESGGQNVEIIDSNGKWSRGILQYQDDTWKWFSAMSGIVGDPMNPEDAKQMTRWAIRAGYLKHWSCAKILGLHYP